MERLVLAPFGVDELAPRKDDGSLEESDFQRRRDFAGGPSDRGVLSDLNMGDPMWAELMVSFNPLLIGASFRTGCRVLPGGRGEHRFNPILIGASFRTGSS